MGWDACRHFLTNFLSVENDDEPPDSSLSLGFFSSNGKNDDQLGGSQFIGIY
jgi:hypothetical protein